MYIRNLWRFLLSLYIYIYIIIVIIIIIIIIIIINYYYCYYIYIYLVHPSQRSRAQALAVEIPFAIVASAQEPKKLTWHVTNVYCTLMQTRLYPILDKSNIFKILKTCSGISGHFLQFFWHWHSLHGMSPPHPEHLFFPILPLISPLTMWGPGFTRLAPEALVVPPDSEFTRQNLVKDHVARTLHLKYLFQTLDSYIIKQSSPTQPKTNTGKPLIHWSNESREFWKGKKGE